MRWSSNDKMQRLHENFRRYFNKKPKKTKSIKTKRLNESNVNKLASFLNEYNLLGEWRKNIINEGDINLWDVKGRDTISDMVKAGTHLKDGAGAKFYNPEKVQSFVARLGDGDLEKGIDVIWGRVQDLQKYTPPSGAPIRGDMPVIPPEKGALKIAAKLLNKGRIDVRPPYAKGGEMAAKGEEEAAEFGEEGYGAGENYKSMAGMSPEEKEKYKAKLAKKGALQQVNEKASDMSPTEIDPKEFPNWKGPQSGAGAQRFLNKGPKDSSGLEDNDAVKVAPASIPASQLFPSQSQIWLGKALVMASGMKPGGPLGAIISKDGHILDGHHRWAMTMLSDPTVKIDGVQADLNIGDLVPVLRNVGDAMGFPRRP